MNSTFRAIPLIAVWSLFATATSAEVLNVEGEIASGSFTWSNSLFDERDGPLLGFPTHLGNVPYTGTLTVDAASAFASFQVSIDSCLAGNEYFATAVNVETGQTEYVHTPTTFRLLRNLFDGIVRNDASAVIIEYVSTPQPGEWVTSFNFELDKTTGDGQWRWSRAPALVCADGLCVPSVPGEAAYGTINAFRIVPEPPALFQAAVTLTAILAMRRTASTSYSAPIRL